MEPRYWTSTATTWTGSRHVISLSLFVLVDFALLPCYTDQMSRTFALQAGDTVGVVRKEDGSLHFFVNGVPQGPAAWNVPPSVYAVVDLYGQAAQATIMDDMGETRGSVGLVLLDYMFINAFAV